MMKRVSILFLPLMLLWTGCGATSDLPPLAPLQIKVSKGGKPASEVTVNIHFESLPSKYGCYGVTNSDGTVSLVTYAHADRRKFTGAPVGTIKVGLHRSSSVGLENPREATKGMSREEAVAYNKERSKRLAANEGYIPAAISDPLISPIEFEVSASQTNSFEIEIDDPRWNVKVDPRRLKKYGTPGR